MVKPELRNKICNKCLINKIKNCREPSQPQAEQLKRLAISHNLLLIRTAVFGILFRSNLHFSNYSKGSPMKKNFADFRGNVFGGLQNCY